MKKAVRGLWKKSKFKEIIQLTNEYQELTITEVKEKTTKEKEKITKEKEKITNET